MGILKSRSFSTPVISVGNITVGGTGKTPHVEYLIRLLKGKQNVAVLSRGYKRKSSGFVLSDKDTPMPMIGDEPFQMKQKFPDITVAVDRKRTRGISKLTADESGLDIDVVLLDDAFQHRYVKPGLSILLVDSNRLITDDALLPAGRLREPASGKQRADIIVVTKCRADMSASDIQRVTRALAPAAHQEIFFSCMEYQRLQPLFCGEDRPLSQLDENVLLVSGIANPSPLLSELRRHTSHIRHLSYPDHHHFTASDIAAIQEAYETLPRPRCIITTEKDAARLGNAKRLSDEARRNIYQLPIRVRILENKQDLFDKKIKNYVSDHSRDRILD
jgi:tetraacyldisaccharide 4'-kinase